MTTKPSIWLSLASVVLATATASAQPADVPGMIKFLDNPPADMDRSVWKEKRRDVAKKLGQSKDKRAVPSLIKLADGETFDIVGEIAIEALGNLADGSAIPTLQKIATDPARDRSQRDLARKALGKLGSSATTTTTTSPPPPPPTTSSSPPSRVPTTMPPPTTTTPTTTTPSTTAARPPTAAQRDPGDSLVDPARPPANDVHAGSKSTPEDLPIPPEIEPDVLAAYERITLAGGTADLGYDTVRKRVAFDADIAGSYAKRVERPGFAYGYDASAHVVAGYINPDGREQERGAQLTLAVDGEARAYTGSLYGIGKAIVSTQLSYQSFIQADPANGDDVKQTSFLGDFAVAIGGGYGRLLDVGGAIRVRRLARALEANHALGRPIDASIARKLQLVWWSLRGERSAYKQLVATVAALRDAGILLGEPDAGLTYELLNVLRDTQLFQRPQGFDAQLVFSEGYLKRPDDPMIENGRVEQLIATVGYGNQLDDDTFEVAGHGFGRLRVLAPDGAPAPWAVGATASVRKFTYGDHGDPFGVFDLSGGLAVTTDDLMGSKVSQEISGQLGFTYVLNQASGLRLAATVTENTGELFVGAQLQLTYGFLDGTFAGL